MILTQLLKGLFQKRLPTRTSNNDSKFGHEHDVRETRGHTYIGASVAGQARNESPRARIRLVCATRENKESFFTNTALGKSWAIYSQLPIDLRLYENNASGLPKIYNQAIEDSKTSPAILVFIHDDLHLCDFFWTTRIFEGLLQFTIVGLVGNKRRVPRQPTWAFIDEEFTWDSRANLSGTVGEGSGFPNCVVGYFGPTSVEVKLLDGLLLAAHSQTLVDNDCYFDEQFEFHFYDLDFCRQAESKGLTMGTCPISAIHESVASLQSTAWRAAYQKYLDKWTS